jgi:hypothetical protein
MNDGRDRAGRRGRTRRALLVGVALLYAASIPWYRDPDSPVATWLGLPDWVTVALACYVGAAVLNALAWLRTDVSDPDPHDGAPTREERAP